MTHERNLAQWYAFLAWPSIGFVLFHSVFILKVFGELPGLHIVQFQAQVPRAVFPYCPVHHGFLDPVVSWHWTTATHFCYPSCPYRCLIWHQNIEHQGFLVKLGSMDWRMSVLPLGVIWSWLLQEMVNLLYVGARNIMEKSSLGRMSCLIASKVETKLGI